jgi:hypothetical protein
MKSIARSIDGPTIAAEVRMERQTHKGSFVLVEGANDIKRFQRVIDAQICSFVNCFGKRNVEEAIEILYDDGFSGALGMVDADFDRILGRPVEREGLAVSANHDFDLDVSATTVFERYLEEVADKAKLTKLGGSRKFFDDLLVAIKPLSAMRYANEKHSLSYRLDSLAIEEFFDGQNLDIDQMVETVSWGKFSSSEAKNLLKTYILRYAMSGIDLRQATCGHDFCAALGIALRQVVGDRKQPQTWRSEIEMHFRLAFDMEHFRETPVFGVVSQWEAQNPPHLILRQ